MAVNLPIVQRDHFYRDPLFKDCWSVMQEERQSAARRSFFMDNHHGNTNEQVPWKWDKVGKFKEFFHEPPNNEKSCEVDTSKWFYKILLDVQQFSPKDLTITLTNRTINIKGFHEERNDLLGAVSRQFTRKFTLPADAVMEKVMCHISLDGVLHITAPRSGVPVITDNENKDAVKHTFPATTTITDITQDNSVATIPDIDDCSITTMPDFDMVPFWAREQKANAQFGIKSDLENFKVVIDVGQFAPEEISIYSTKHYIKIEGKHQEKQDAHGYISRSFTRKYWMPSGVNAEDLKCQLSSGGVLEIMAPMPKNHTEESMKVVRLPVVLIEEAQLSKWVDPQLI